MAKLAALSRNAGATPQAATWRHPAARVRSGDDGGRSPLAATSSCLPTMPGGIDAEAGLKNSAPAESLNAIA